jgi:uncharacterized membrane protein
MLDAPVASPDVNTQLPDRRRGSDAGMRAIAVRRVLVWGLVCSYAIFFSVVSVARHEAFQSGTFDLAFMDQALWSTLRGDLLGVSIEPELTTSELGYHFEPILFPIALLYLFNSSPTTLLVLQSCVLALGALPASWLAFERLKSNFAAVAFAVAYLLFPGLQAANMFDFHPFALSATLLLFAFYFMERRQYGAFALFAALAMGTKENVPLTIAMFGLYLLVMKRELKPGLLTIAGAGAWFWLASYVIIPAYSSEGQGWLWNRYGGMGGSPWEIIGFLLAHPERLIEPSPGLSNVHYMAQLLFPVAFLSLLHPATFLLAAPGLATNLLTVYEAMHFLETYHYTSSLVPIVIISAIYGSSTMLRLARRLPVIRPGPLIWFLGAAVLVCSFTYHYYRGYTPLSPSFAVTWPGHHQAVGQRIAALIPPEAAVAAQWNLGPHVSQRSQFTMFANIDPAEYVFLDVATQPNSVGFDEGIHTLLRDTVRDPRFGIVAAEDGLILLQRGAPPRELPDEFFSFARAGDAAPTYPLSIRFGDAVELLGFDVWTARDARVDLIYYWRALRPLDEDYLLATYLLDDQGRELGATVHPQPANFWYPTSLWQAGEVVQVQTHRLPWEAPEGSFGLAVGVVAGEDPWNAGRRLAPQVRDASWLVSASGDGTLAELATFRNDRRLVSPTWANRPRGSASGQTPVSFDGRFDLVGYAMTPAALAAGDAFQIDLDWQVRETVDRPLTTFVHVLAPGPTLVAQKDAPPAAGRLPTTFWLPGDYVSDSFNLQLPPDLIPGEYDVAIGFYDPATGERVEVVDPKRGRGDHLILEQRLIVASGTNR